MGKDFCCENIQTFFVPKGGSRILDIGLGLALTDGLQEIKVRGAVRGKDGAPIRNASVTFSSVFSPQRWDQTRTNEAGEYEFSLTQPGQYVLYATKPGFIAQAATVDVGSGDVEKKDIELRPGQAQGLGPQSKE
jgi:protocatechuate 3,4-dioxygenase beta subunit